MKNKPTCWFKRTNG